MRDTAELLKSVFGFDAFRPGQAEVVGAILAGRDVLAIMPTGGGKSLCFQLPAIRREGLTLVVSPLIALMRDQVAALREAGVEAGALTSANDPWETERVFAALEAGKLRLLYMAPERLASEATIGMLRRANVTLLAFDGAQSLRAVGDEAARALAAHDHALRLEAVVGARHGVGVDGQLLGELAHRGQLRAALHLAARHRPLHLEGELLENRLGTLGIEGEQHGVVRTVLVHIVQ
jgi:hypothetical protein